MAMLFRKGRQITFVILFALFVAFVLAQPTRASALINPTEVFEELSQGQKAKVLIDELPSVNEVNAAEHYTVIHNVYSYYKGLSEGEKEKVDNADKLTQLFETVNEQADELIFNKAETIASSDGEGIARRYLGDSLSLVKTIVSAVGSIILMWGLYEWGTSLYTQEPSSGPHAYNRIGAGILLVLTPAIITALF